MSDKVTVIMPCYNQAQYAREAIESVLSQTHKDLEVLLIDNASTDGTREIIKEYEKKDPRVRAIYHEKNMRFEYSFTEGMREATGDFISFTSSDDVWHPTKVEEQLRVLENNPDCDFCHTDADIIDEKGKKNGRTIRQLYRTTIAESGGNTFLALTRKDICCCSSILFRRKCLETYSEFDPNLRVAHDWWFNIKISQKHRFAYTPRPLVDYRIHPHNFSKKKDLVMEDYIIIHRRLAEMGVEPQRHYISVATSAARMGKNKEAKEAIREARKHGKLKGQASIIAFIIEKFRNCGSILEALNRPKHQVLNLIYKFK